MGLLTTASVAIDGSKFKAVNTRDKNFTRGKVERRRAQLEESVARYLAQLDTADRQEPSEELAAKTAHLREKLVKLEGEMQRLAAMEKSMLASPDQQISLTDPDSRSIESLASVGYKELKKNGAFLLPGFAKFVVLKKPATKERAGVNPFTKEPTVFKARPARKIVRARPVKAAKDAV